VGAKCGLLFVTGIKIWIIVGDCGGKI